MKFDELYPDPFPRQGVYKEGITNMWGEGNCEHCGDFCEWYDAFSEHYVCSMICRGIVRRNMTYPVLTGWVHLSEKKIQELRALYLWYWEPDWMFHDMRENARKYLNEAIKAHLGQGAELLKTYKTFVGLTWSEEELGRL